MLGGRALLIWLPVFVLLAPSLPPFRAVLATSVITAIWTIGLRAALCTYFTLGPAVASAAGTIMGLVAISALDLWVGLELGAVRLAEAAIAVFLLSAAWEHVVRSIAKRRVLVVGTGGCASEVLSELRNGHHAPFTMLGLVGERGDTEGVPMLGSFEELSQIVAAQRPDIVILTDEQVSAWAVDPLLDLAPAGFRVVGVSHFIEHALGRVPLRHLTPAWFMSMLHLRQKPYTRVAKRAFDLVVASLGLLLAAPLLPFLVLLVRSRRARSSTARRASARAAAISPSSSSGRCARTRRTPARRATRRSATTASRASAGSCAGRISTSCRSSGTCSVARCRSSGRAPSDPSSSTCWSRRFRSGRGACW